MMNKNIRISDLELNEGQIEGLPKNPRFIRDTRFDALKKSIEDAPEMLALRELLVYPHPEKEGKYVVIGGNMRLRACRELGYKEVPCKVIDASVPVEKLREYTIKDNVAFGEIDWDALANEWDTEELTDWGLECKFLESNEADLDAFFKEVDNRKNDDSNEDIIIEIHVPKEESDEVDTITDIVRKSLLDYPNISVRQ